MHTERGFDRIVNFSDATVAIAMTLLVLPLVDFGGETGEHGATALYVGVLLASSVSLHLLGRHGRRHQELLHDRPEVKEWLAGPYTWTTPAVLAVILVLVVIVPSVGAWPMLLLFVDGIVENRIVQRRKAAAAG